MFSTRLTTRLITGEGRRADAGRGEREAGVPFVSVGIKCTRVFDPLQDACLTSLHQTLGGRASGASAHTESDEGVVTVRRGRKSGRYE